MKISIVGLGKVGSAIAFSLLHKIELDELALVDIAENLVRGEALDLGHSSVYLNPNIKILQGKDYSLIENSNVVIITAGKPRTADQTRDELFDFNKKIIESVCNEVKQHAPNSKIIILTNPSTQIGEFAKTMLNNEIVVMDNQLDTARLKYFIKEEANIPVSQIKSSIAGEHGENMQINFEDDISDEMKDKIRKLVVGAGKEIISLKGYTCWGIASRVLKEVEKLIKK